MEPTVVGAAAYGAVRVFSACSRGVQDANNSVAFAKRKYRLAGTYDVAWLDSDFAPSASEDGFTAEQIGDVGKFLTSDGVRPYLSLLAVACLTDEPDTSLIIQVKNGLSNEARKWNGARKKSWLKFADRIWDRLLELHQEVLPTVGPGAAYADDITYFEDFINTPLQRQASAPGGHTARFVKHLVNIGSDVERLRTAFDATTSVASHMSATALDPIITHTDTGKGTSADFELLYVDRSFVNYDDGRPLDSSLIAAGNTPFRLMVTGAPGAGKTTYLQHFRHRYCAEQARPVFVVRCREYAAINWDRTSLVDFALDRYNSEYSDDMEPSTIRDILALGRGALVLDGLDEVIDPLRRIDLSKRINALASLFPLASILITSREVGYDRAPVDARIFARVELKEFELDQALIYVKKWFKLVDKPQLTDAFIHDSEQVADIRLNPLMLSLLCLLYRESGSIPSRRLDIYEECARLLFKRWDSHRRIMVDGAIPDFSDLLMQEIARWYYTSPSAQGGLDETVIRGMLKHILVDQSGFPGNRAEEAAADFLEFCAGRAWLLGVTGSNDRGERLFSFTHKTFSEYFAAESFAINARDDADICTRIINTFTNDSSSVLPELLIQSYGKHSSQGAVRVLRKLVEDGAPTLLLLRLVEGTKLPAWAREQVFTQLQATWIFGAPNKAEFLALLQLNALAREQWVTGDLTENRQLREIFLSGWADVVLSGTSDRYASRWAESIQQLTAMTDIRELAGRDSSIWTWQVLEGDSVLPATETSHMFSCEGSFGVSPGLIWYGVERRLRYGKPPLNEKFVLECIRDAVTQIERRQGVESSLLRLVYALLLRGSSQTDWTVRWSGDLNDSPEFALFTYIALGLYEWAPEGRVKDRVSSLWDGALRELVQVRSAHLAGKKPSPEILAQAVRVLRALPERAALWTVGRQDLVVWDTPDWEDELLFPRRS
ncbi:putative NTPase (NACHT family) [Mycolicibacterium chubuense NBB4]|uniref:Putative NTPase (NACHT family) n=1 Tax=Mycolicibacterium chubuense (strain NBB4) TaxID=710421 RepID=I4BNT0_MYCCN|nr:NACHT domain-containing protein [Mycolicibacterium chubuense]AFM18937.1 putative NTPase (NACHT family) [Mycolicibacterium chubuense NBB4]